MARTKRPAKRLSRHAKKTEANSRSPLLALPAELRNRIYRHALVEKRRIAPGMTNTRGETSKIVEYVAKVIWIYHDYHLGVVEHHQQPGLLQACHQIRAEATGIYYKENDFSVIIPEFDATKYLRWCRLSPEHRDCKPDIMPYCEYPASENGWTEEHSQNLIVWLEAVWKGECQGYFGVGSETRYHLPNAAARIMRLAERMRDEQGLTWEQGKENLVSVLELLERYEQGPREG